PQRPNRRGERRADDRRRLQRPLVQQLAHQPLRRRRGVAVRPRRTLVKLAGHVVAMKIFPPQPDAAFDLRIMILRADAINSAMAQLPKMAENLDDMRIWKEPDRRHVVLTEI